MNVFKNIFKKEKSNIIVECFENQIKINGSVVTFPTNLDVLSKILGEPDRSTRRKTSYIYSWDDLGIYINSASASFVLWLNFLISKNNHKYGNAVPKKLFTGVIKVNGKEINYQNTDDIKLGNIKLGNLRWERKNIPPYAFHIIGGLPEDKPTPKDKYLIKKPNEDIIDFKDFGFKLSIIQVLMYDKELLKPKFDLYEFVKWYSKRDIDIEKEGYGPIPEVTQYFKDLPIPKSLAKEVTEIYQDGGDKIYLQLLRFGDGTENYWDIESVEDAKHFPNLKKATLCYAKDNVLEDFKNLGINASWL